MTQRPEKAHNQALRRGQWGRFGIAMVVVLLSGTTLLAGAFRPDGAVQRISQRHLAGFAVPPHGGGERPTLASVLKQNLPPPPTLRPQLVSRDPAGDDEVSCVVGTAERGDTAATPSDCIAEITDWLSLWYRDFPTSKDGIGQLVSALSVAMAQPNGQVRLFTVTEATQMLYLRPGMPLGRYEFTASGSGKTVTGGFTVKSPTQRTLRVAFNTSGEDQVRPGTPVNVDLAGYPASSTVSLHLYRHLSHRDVDTGLTTWRYATLISRVSVDSLGQAATSFSTEPGDPLGQYLVYSDPPQVSDLNAARFELIQ